MWSLGYCVSVVGEHPSEGLCLGEEACLNGNTKISIFGCRFCVQNAGLETQVIFFFSGERGKCSHLRSRVLFKGQHKRAFQAKDVIV